MTLHQVLRRSGDSLAALDLCSDPGSAAGATGGSQVGNWDRGLGMNVICLFFSWGELLLEKGQPSGSKPFWGILYYRIDFCLLYILLLTAFGQAEMSHNPH